MSSHVTYQDFFTPAEVEAYKRVKRGSMRLARIARDVLAEMVSGEISAIGKEFLITREGVYRVSMGDNSDNTTEAAAHERLGATRLVMGDEAQMAEFFSDHGYTDTHNLWRVFLLRVRVRLSEPPE